MTLYYVVNMQNPLSCKIKRIVEERVTLNMLGGLTTDCYYSSSDSLVDHTILLRYKYIANPIQLLQQQIYYTLNIESTSLWCSWSRFLYSTTHSVLITCMSEINLYATSSGDSWPRNLNIITSFYNCGGKIFIPNDATSFVIRYL